MISATCCSAVERNDESMPVEFRMIIPREQESFGLDEFAILKNKQVVRLDLIRSTDQDTWRIKKPLRTSLIEPEINQITGVSNESFQTAFSQQYNFVCEI